MDNKKKAGILTFHDADNLGAVLQAFALSSVLENECGVSAEIVDYKCKKITATKYPSRCGGIKDYIKLLPMHVYYAVKRHGFKSFRKKMLICSEKVFTKENVKDGAKEYDFFITGSDQVWNPECSDGDSTYILDFVSDKRKKYSYAASIGNYELEKADSTWINAIKDYQKISVREKSAAEQLNNLGISEVSVHSDPVILLSDEQWKSVMSKRIIFQKYVLVYLVLPDVNVMNQAKEYAEKHNCKIINNKKSIEFILHNSPSDFLSWIYHADCVFTNSFHGTAFSLIFNKQLFADIEMENGRINNRVYDLLSATDSLQCAEKSIECKICNNSAEKAFENMRKSSLKYLKSICDNIQQVGV